ncbi:MAG: amino acid permease, partial [Halobacteria archaeon]|nr:amino acid permease [Halobacteria archaeon]
WFYRFILPLFELKQAMAFWIPGIVILALLVALNLKGTEESGKFQIVVTALKVGLIILFLFGGLQAFDAGSIASSFAENFSKFREIGVTSALVFITFFGFEAIATNAEEIKEPGRTIPRAIFISMGFVTLIYSLVVLVVVLAKSDPAFLSFLVENVEGLAEAAGAEEFIRESGELAMGYAAQFYLGNIGFYVIIVGALFSMLSAANATILAGSRVKLAMSRRDHLPSRFEELHDSFNTPYNSVLLTGGLIFSFIFLFTVVFGGGPESEAVLHLPFSVPLVGASLHLGIEAIAHFADFMLLTGLIVVNLALVQSRRKYPDIDRSFEVPGVPYVPIVAVLANLVLIVNVEPSSFLIGLLAQVVGVGVYFTVLSSDTSAEEAQEEAPTVVAEHEPSERDYQILVPISNPDHVEQLMRTADDIAQEKDGEVLVMSAVTLPEQTPLEKGKKFVDEKRDVLERAMELSREADVPVSGVVKIGHHASDAILHTVKEHDSDAVLMGWRGRRSHRRDIVLGSTVDAVVQEAECDVLVERIGETEDVESVLVPVAGGPHAEFAVGVARSIAVPNDARVKLIRVVDEGTEEIKGNEPDEALDELVGSIFGGEGGEGEQDGDGVGNENEGEKARDVEVETEVVSDDDVVDAIVRESENHEITVVGATREGLLQQFVFGAIPEEVGRKAEGVVIMAKKNLGITSKLVHWFRWS